MTVKDINEINQLLMEIRENLNLALESMKMSIESDPIEAFAMLKFDKIGFDPIKGNHINFIEMLNQSYSDIVVLKATAELMKRYSQKEFKLNMGAVSGIDICSTDGSIVAECFAVVSVFNNQKMKKDTEKLLQFDENAEKYIFYYSREDEDGRIKKFTNRFPQITYIRIKDFH